MLSYWEVIKYSAVSHRTRIIQRLKMFSPSLFFILLLIVCTDSFRYACLYALCAWLCTAWSRSSSEPVASAAGLETVWHAHSHRARNVMVSFVMSTLVTDPKIRTQSLTTRWATVVFSASDSFSLHNMEMRSVHKVKLLRRNWTPGNK